MSEPIRRSSVEEIKRKFEPDSLINRTKPDKPHNKPKRTPAFRCDRTPNIPKSQSNSEINLNVEKSRRFNHSDPDLNEPLDYKVKLISKQKNIAEQYATVHKPRGIKNDQLKLTESLRIALKAPLPKGPPPKKPPRLFTHKTTSARDKLDKIENFVKTLDKTQRVIAPRTVSEDEKRILENKENSLNGLCMKNSELTSHLQDALLGQFSNLTMKQKLLTKEPIYDQPFKLTQNDSSQNHPATFETFGKTGYKQVSNFRHLHHDSDLHYLCTDITHQPSPPTDLNNKPFQRDKIRQTLSDDLGSNKKISEILPIRKSSLGDETLTLNRLNKTVNDVKILMNQAFGSPSTPHVIDSNSDSDSADSGSRLESDENGSSLIDDNERKSIERQEQRKVYVKRVSSLFLNNDTSFLKNSISNNNLFDACLLVGLTTTEPENGQKKRNVPYIKSVFPSHVKPPDSIESFCFPDADNWDPGSGVQNPKEQCYSIVLTNERGKRVFGYCRRVLPEGGLYCLPLAYCIISPHRANGFFHKVLKELESRHGFSGLDHFIKQLHECEFPNPGQSLKLNKILEKVTRTSPMSNDTSIPSTLVRRPQDVRLEERDLTQLIQLLPIPVFLKLFASILMERRVILIAKSLSTLSLCMEGLQSILHPFTWQHTYIPVLPSHLLEFCQAPTPYMFGILRSAYQAKDFINFSDGILVDVDEGKVLKCCKDESTILPGKFSTSLQSALNLAEKYATSGESNVIISEAFIRFFVEVCGHYLIYMKTSTDGTKIFNKEEFLKHPESASIRKFLEWFTETAMFYMFIQERLHYDVQDLFRRRVVEFSDESEKNLALLNKNYKMVNKQSKIFDELRDKLFSK